MTKEQPPQEQLQQPKQQPRRLKTLEEALDGLKMSINFGPYIEPFKGMPREQIRQLIDRQENQRMAYKELSLEGEPSRLKTPEESLISPLKTIEEVEELKRGWMQDPCWELGGTQGFELYREELEAFQRVCETNWAGEHQQKLEDKAVSLGAAGNTLLAVWVLGLEAKLSKLEDQLDRHLNDEDYFHQMHHTH